MNGQTIGANLVMHTAPCTVYRDPSYTISNVFKIGIIPLAFVPVSFGKT